MDKGVGALVAVFSLLIGLAMVAVLVSQKANTSAVIQALSSGGAGLLKAAVSPVTGGGASGTTGG
jgi:CHASE1-domain containing sensor protein